MQIKSAQPDQTSAVVIRLCLLTEQLRKEKVHTKSSRQDVAEVDLLNLLWLDVSLLQGA